MVEEMDWGDGTTCTIMHAVANECSNVEALF